MNNIGGYLAHSNDGTLIMDYAKNQGFIDERGVITSGELFGGQLANVRQVPEQAADMIFRGLSRTDKDTGPADEIIGMVATMYQVGGPNPAAFNDLIRQTAGQPNRLFLETTLQAIGDKAEAMGLFTPDGNLSVRKDLVLQAIRAEVHSFQSIDDVDPRDTDAAFAAMKSAVLIGDFDRDDDTKAEFVVEYVQGILEEESVKMGAYLRTEMGPGIAIDVSGAELGIRNEARALGMYRDVIHGLYMKGLTGTALAEAAQKAFYVRFESEFDMVVTDDHVDGNPKGEWVYSGNIDADQRWYQPMTTGPDGTQQMQLPPWALLKEFVTGNPDRFVSNGLDGDPETVEDWAVTRVSPAPSGKGWVLWNSMGMPITWTPEKPDDWKKGDAVPQREMFIMDIPQLRRFSEESGFADAHRKAMAHVSRPQDGSFNIGSVLMGHGPSVLIEQSKRNR